MVRLLAAVLPVVAASEDLPLADFDDAVSLLQLSTRRVEDSLPDATDAQRWPVGGKPALGPDGTWGTAWCEDMRGCAPYCPNGCDGAAYWDAPFENDRLGIPDIQIGRRNNKMNFYVCDQGRDLGVPIGKFQGGLTFTFMQCKGSENATKAPAFQEKSMEWKQNVGPYGKVMPSWNGGKIPANNQLDMEGYGYEYCPAECVNDCAMFKWGNFHQCGQSTAGRRTVQWFYDNTADPHENQNCKADAVTYKGVGIESYLWCGEPTTTTTTTTEPPVVEPPKEEDTGAAVGDPHITTNVGTHFDLSFRQKVKSKRGRLGGNPNCGFSADACKMECEKVGKTFGVATPRANGSPGWPGVGDYCGVGCYTYTPRMARFLGADTANSCVYGIMDSGKHPESDAELASTHRDWARFGPGTGAWQLYVRLPNTFGSPNGVDHCEDLEEPTDPEPADTEAEAEAEAPAKQEIEDDDEAAAVGDPHMTTNTGETFDYMPSL